MTKPTHFVREQGHEYADYAAIPESAGRYELLDGELHAMSPAPALSHQMVSTQLQKVLYACDEEYVILNAPVDVILSSHSVLQPDIVMVHKTRTHILAKRGVEGPPDLVVEILSPSSIQRDRGQKMQIYAHYGVFEYWIVDAANVCLEQYLLAEGKFSLASVYIEDMKVQSPRIQCATFSMEQIMKKVPTLDEPRQ